MQSIRGGTPQKMKFVFLGDMCVEGNTSQPTNVRTVRYQRTVSAMQWAAIRRGWGFVPGERLSKILFDSRNALRPMPEGVVLFFK